MNKNIVKYEYICKNCGTLIPLNTYPVINLQSDTDLIDKLFSLDLFKVTCNNCNTTATIQYDTLIVDMYKKYMVYLHVSGPINTFYDYVKTVIDTKFKSSKEQLEVWNSLKYTRLTTSLNELLEKLLIYDYDLDDRLIELVKLGLYEKNRLDENIYESIRFNKIEKEQLIFTCFNQSDLSIQPIEIAVDSKYYNILIDSVGGVNNIKSEDFMLIDKNWAKQIIEKEY